MDLNYPDVCFVIIIIAVVVIISVSSQRMTMLVFVSLKFMLRLVSWEP